MEVSVSTEESDLERWFLVRDEPRRCHCCGAANIPGNKFFAHPLWPNHEVCPECVSSCLQCFACERKTQNPKWIASLSTWLCNSCSVANPVVSTSHAVKCFFQAVMFVEHMLGMPVLPIVLSGSQQRRVRASKTRDRDSNPSPRFTVSVPVNSVRWLPDYQLISLSETNSDGLIDLRLPAIAALSSKEILRSRSHCSTARPASSPHGGVAFGRCDLYTVPRKTEGGTHGRGNKIRVVSGIYALAGSPEVLFISLLCHELIHVLLFLSPPHNTSSCETSRDGSLASEQVATRMNCSTTRQSRSTRDVSQARPASGETSPLWRALASSCRTEFLEESLCDTFAILHLRFGHNPTACDSGFRAFAEERIRRSRGPGNAYRNEIDRYLSYWDIRSKKVGTTDGQQRKL